MLLFQRSGMIGVSSRAAPLDELWKLDFCTQFSFPLFSRQDMLHFFSVMCILCIYLSVYVLLISRMWIIFINLFCWSPPCFWRISMAWTFFDCDDWWRNTHCQVDVSICLTTDILSLFFLSSRQGMQGLDPKVTFLFHLLVYGFAVRVFWNVRTKKSFPICWRVFPPPNVKIDSRNKQI